MPTIIDGTNGIDKIAAGAIEYADLPAGSVLQVVNATYGTMVTTTSSTYSDTGLTATITPKFATSKILVIVSQNGVGKNTSDLTCRIKLQRNGSDILSMAAGAAYTQTGAYNDIGSVSANKLDSPATTSATTYKTVFSAFSPGSTAFVQEALAGVESVSSITLMEIAA